jgi:hypothetical protein
MRLADLRGRERLCTNGCLCLAKPSAAQATKEQAPAKP